MKKTFSAFVFLYSLLVYAPTFNTSLSAVIIFNDSNIPGDDVYAIRSDSENAYSIQYGNSGIFLIDQPVNLFIHHHGGTWTIIHSLSRQTTTIFISQLMNVEEITL